MNEEEFEYFSRRWKVIELLGIGCSYQCTVDGHGEFRGEILPAGTVESILIWIRARYKVIGEVSVSDCSAAPWTRYIFTRIVDPSHWYYETEVKRYLVEVEGVEKLFKLEPFPAGLLPWYEDGTKTVRRERGMRPPAKENSSRSSLMCEIVL